VDRARARSTRGRGRTSSRAPPRRPRPRAPRRRPRRQPPPAARHGSRGPTSVEHLACARSRGCTSMFRRRRLAISMPACLVMIMSPLPQDERAVPEGIRSEDGVLTSANLKPGGRRKTLAAPRPPPALACADAAGWRTEARAWNGGRREAKANPADEATASSLYATRQEEAAFEFRTGRKLTWTEQWDPRAHVDVASRGTRPAGRHA
jgi:hypothetical protein